MTSLIAERRVPDPASMLRVTSERSRLPTGYGPLDEALNGGYPRGYSILLSSPSCDERALLLRRFIECEIEDALTICVTRDFGRVADLAYAHRCSLQVVICHDLERVSGMRNIVHTPRYDDLCSLNIALSSILRRMGPDLHDRRPKRLVVDVISDVLLSRGVLVTRNWLWNMIVRMKARGFTILGVFNHQMHLPADAQAIVELFDGHISIEECESAHGRRKSIQVRKMYACEYDRSELELDRDELIRPLKPNLG